MLQRFFIFVKLAWSGKRENCLLTAQCDVDCEFWERCSFCKSNLEYWLCWFCDWKCYCWTWRLVIEYDGKLEIIGNIASILHLFCKFAKDGWFGELSYENCRSKSADYQPSLIKWRLILRERFRLCKFLDTSISSYYYLFLLYNDFTK